MTTVSVRPCAGGGSGGPLPVHEHRRHLHQLPVGPRPAPGLPGDAALHRGAAAARDREPETGEEGACGSHDQALTPCP